MDHFDSSKTRTTKLVAIVRRFWGNLQNSLFGVALFAYGMVLVTCYAYYGILFQLSPGIFFLAGIPVMVALGKSQGVIREVAPFIVVLLSYEALQGLAGVFASGHVLQIVHPSTFNLVAAVQSEFYSEEVTDVATLFYSLHFPLVITSAILFWYTDKTTYRKYSYSIIAVSYVSLIIYAIAPTPPPWYTGAATNLLQASGPHPASTSFWSTFVSLGDRIESDQLAAFPSLHAAYAALFCYFTAKSRRIYGLVSAPITAGVLFSTIYLGQHFLIDLAAGILVAGCCAVGVSKLLTRNKVKLSGTNVLDSRISH